MLATPDQATGPATTPDTVRGISCKGCDQTTDGFLDRKKGVLCRISIRNPRIFTAVALESKVNDLEIYWFRVRVACAQSSFLGLARVFVIISISGVEVEELTHVLSWKPCWP